MIFSNLLKPNRLSETKTVQVTGVLLDELKAMSPGQVYRMDGRDGRTYGIMEWDDLEMILERAGMRTQGKT